MRELRHAEPGRGALLHVVRGAARRRRADTRAAQGRHRPLLRPRRLDGARRVDRPGGAARAHAPLLRGSARRSSSATAAPSRSSSATRSWPSSGSRSRTRTTRCARFAPQRRCRRRSRSTGSRPGSGSTPARSSSAARARRSSPATRSTSPRGSSRRRAQARCSSEPRRSSLVRDAVRVEAVEPLDAQGKGRAR